jgi:hypothetical protein
MKKAAPRSTPRAEKADGEAAVLAAIAEMPAPYDALGERLHALITASALTDFKPAEEARIGALVKKVAG